MDDRLKRTTSLQQAIKRSTVLSSLLSHGRRLERVRQELARLLPPELDGRWGVANLRDGELVLYAVSPAWATRLRFLSGELLRALAELEPGVRRIRVRVCMPPAGEREVRRTGPALSRRSASMLEEVASGLEHEGLRVALQRIARHGEG
ncbi:MAG: DUF721 domain-containing protein [Gammaproteobacteria bacterium]|nr:MAG: DUF721 domain-containing protein [Gammaproteobacteria bacterium]